MQLSYPVAIEEVDGEFVVGIRGVPEAVTSGDTRAEARALAADALEVLLGVWMDEGRDLPEPLAPAPGEEPVPLPPTIGAKVAVYLAWKKSGIDRGELARRLGIGETQVRDLLSSKAATPLPLLARAADVLDARLVIGLEPA